MSILKFYKIDQRRKELIISMLEIVEKSGKESHARGNGIRDQNGVRKKGTFDLCARISLVLFILAEG